MSKIKVTFVETNCKKNGPIKQTLNIIRNMDKEVFEPSLVTVWPEDADNSMIRLVHSEFRQYFHTFSPWISDPRHIGNTIHLWTAFVSGLKTSLTVALCRLHRAL